MNKASIIIIAASIGLGQLVFVNAEAAVSFRFGYWPPRLCPLNGHYYVNVATDKSPSDVWSIFDCEAFAERTTYLGLTGHILTIDDWNEYNNCPSYGMQLSGNLGAVGSCGLPGSYTWVFGPSAGRPVNYFGGFYIPNVTCGQSHCAYPPLNRLARGANVYGPAGSWADWDCDYGFVIEFEAWSPTPINSVTWGGLKARFN